jgi:hypothetical protein
MRDGAGPRSATGGGDQTLREPHVGRKARRSEPERRAAQRRRDGFAGAWPDATASLLGSENCGIRVHRGMPHGAAAHEHPKRERVRIRGQLRRADRMHLSFFPVGPSRLLLAVCPCVVQAE